MAVTDLNEAQQLTNQLRNGGMETWLSGASSPQYWTLTGAGGTAIQDLVNLHLGAASVKVTRAGADVRLTQNAIGQTLPIAYARGKVFTLAARVKKEAGKQARIKLDDGVGVSASGFACETDEWQLITVDRTIDNAASKIDCILEVFAVDGSCWFDSIMLLEGLATPAFLPNPADVQDPANLDQTSPSTPTGLAAATRPLAILLTWTVNPEPDIDSYEIQRADDAGFSVNAITWRVDALRFQDVPGNTTTHWYRLRAVRESGSVSPYTTGVSAAASPVDESDIETTPPGTPTGVSLATGTALGPDGTVQVYLNISWSANPESDLNGYQYDYRRQGDTPFASRIVRKETLSVREIGVVGNIVYEVRVSAIDKFGNASAFTSLQTITTATDSSAPSAPTSVSLTPGFQLIVVRWAPPAAVDWDVVEIWRSTTNDSSIATKVGEHRGIMWVDDKLANGTTYYYWLKSRDTSGNASAFHATQFAGTSATTLQIATGDLGPVLVAPGQALNRDPACQDKSAWYASVVYGDTTPLGAAFSNPSISDGPNGRGVLRYSGDAALSFASSDIPIDITRTYRLSVWIRRTVTTGGVVYLTAAFADGAGANIQGIGSGATGWAELGTYFHWGLSSQEPPPTWQKYTITFGPVGTATFPTSAIPRTVRIGCLVNFNAQPGTVIEFQDFRLEEVIPSTLIQAGAITADKIAANVITAGHLRTDTAVITLAAQIASAIIGNAHISDLSADKITAGFLNVLIRLGVNNIEIDGVNSVITIKDTQGTPVTRVQMGKLGAGLADWGMKIWNAAGALMWDFSSGAQTAGIAQGAVSEQVDFATADIATIIANGTEQAIQTFTITGANAGTVIGHLKFLLQKITGGSSSLTVRIRKTDVSGAILDFLSPVYLDNNAVLDDFAPCSLLYYDSSPDPLSQSYVLTMLGVNTHQWRTLQLKNVLNNVRR